MNCISSNEEERQFSSWILDRKGWGTVVRLCKGLNTIGRHFSSNIRVLGYPYVSRHHGLIFIEPDEEKITLRDVGSLNGVYVNNQLYSVGVQLKAGDLIGIGAEYTDHPFEDKDLPIYELRYEPIYTSRSRRQESNDNTNKNENGGSMCGMCTKRENVSNENSDVIVLISDDEDDNGNGIE